MQRPARESARRSSAGNARDWRVRDYLKSDTRTDCERQCNRRVALPKSNVLYFELEDRRVDLRAPQSGTEPKIKLYVNTNASNPEELRKGERRAG